MNSPTEILQSTENKRGRDLKLFNVFTGLFVTVLVVSTIASSKIFAVGSFFLPGGVIVFPILFIFNDILTEVYGYAQSRRVIWTGLFCQAFVGIVLAIVTALPPAPFWDGQPAFQRILGFVPRVALAGLMAYFSGEFANSFVLSKMKYLEQGARGLKQGWRFVASTMVGEGVDSIVFMLVAYGSLMKSDLLNTLITLYVVKVLYEIVALPFTVKFSNWVKKIEGVDHIDTPQGTNYNPFSVLFNSRRRKAIENSRV